MKITIFGAGHVGGTLGKSLAKAGHAITFAVRNPSDARVQSLVRSIGESATAQRASEATSVAEVVILCIPWDAVEEMLTAARRDIAGKIVIDATNPVDMTLDELRRGSVLDHDTSGAEHVAQWAPDAHVVKAFNTTGWENMADPTYAAQSLSMMLCGDDEPSKKVVAELVCDAGFDPVDAGLLRAARYLEAMAMLWIGIATQGFGRDFAFQFIKR